MAFKKKEVITEPDPVSPEVKEELSLTDISPDVGEVVFHHRGRMGMISYGVGVDPLTRKPITKEIKFENHRYKTSDPTEIKEIDLFASKTGMVNRLDDFAIMQASEPKSVTIEFGGKKYTMPLDSLKDIAKERLEEEQRMINDGEKIYQVKTN